MTDGVIFFDGSSSRKRSVTLLVRRDARHRRRRRRHRLAGPMTTSAAPKAAATCCALSAIGAPELARLEIHDDALAREVTARAHKLDVIQKERFSALRIVGWSLAACGLDRARHRLRPALRGRSTDAAHSAKFRAPAGRRGAAPGRRCSSRTKACDRVDGKAAFDKLGDAGAPGRRPRYLGDARPLSVRPYPTRSRCRAARPFLFKACSTRRRSPDEIAAVVAHELGHVAHRDHLRA